MRHNVPMFDAFGFLAIIPVLIIGFFFLIFFGVVGLIIFIVVKNVQKAKELGHDPFTMETELTARAIDSQLLAPENKLENRLQELDDLRARGVITVEEHAKARGEAIAAG